jgi:hypothetical protein
VAFTSGREGFPAELEYSSPSHVAVSADTTVGLTTDVPLAALSITSTARERRSSRRRTVCWNPSTTCPRWSRRC